MKKQQLFSTTRLVKGIGENFCGHVLANLVRYILLGNPLISKPSHLYISPLQNNTQKQRRIVIDTVTLMEVLTYTALSK